MITLNDNNTYIESKNIRVFPCAYRGYYNDNTPLVFDPEARATTEANFTNTFHKLSANKDSYVVSWVPGTDPKYPNAGTLKCVIGGYYFEIYNHEMSNFFYSEGSETKPYYLCIKTESITLGTSASDATDARTTKVLSSFADSTNYLDVYDDTLGQYAFTGLLVSKAVVENATARLAPFMQGTGFFKIDLTSTEPTEKIGKYYGTEGTSELIKITSANASQVPAGAQFYVKSESYTINSAMLPITNLLDVGSGNYSIRMIEDITDQGANTTVASGDYSVALGLGTAATGEASTALGNNTEASAKGAFAAGNATVASNEGAVALGSATTASGANAVALGFNTKAVADNQVVIGQYSTEDTEQAFIVANGKATAGSNKFTVSYDGDVKTLGTLETKGNIKATGNSNNDLELGTSAEGSSGSIKVYGETEADTPVFSVENSGNTTIAGTINISGSTTITSMTEYTTDPTTTGALLVYGGVGIGKKLNVGGTAKIAGNTQITNTAAASGNTAALTVKGGEIVEKNLIIKGTDTATSTTTGALVVGGGAGISENLYIGGTTTVTGETNLNNNLTVATDKATQLGGDLTVDKATALKSTLEVTGATTLKNITTVANNTESTSTTTGALVVGGGVGIGKNLHVGGGVTLTGNLTVADTKTTTLGGPTTIKGNTQIASTTDYSETADGVYSAALVINGGTYIAKKLHVAGDATFYENLAIGSDLVAIKALTQSTAANNGALVVSGGVGIGKNLNIAGETKIAKNLTLAGTAGEVNTLQLGNASNSNKGGELLIYGAGTTTVFSVDNAGNTDLEGNLAVKGNISGGNKLSIGSGATAIEISSTGITGLSGLTVTGQINATVFNAASDARLKCNIEDYKFNKSILDLPIKRFEYIKDNSHTKYIGCLAQDLQEICPELVNENPDGTLSIQESKLVYALLQEVKELKEKVDLLERR